MNEPAARRRRLQPFAPTEITPGGLIGRRIALTWQNNLLALNWDRDFLEPFRAKTRDAGHYVGLGKTLDGLVRLGAHTGNQRLLTLRRHILDTLFAAQESDGYLGTYRPADRILWLWDAHEQAYLLLALVTDWECFREEPSLAAARRLGNHLVRQLPPGTLSQLGPEVCPHLAVLGLDRALLALHRATGDRTFLGFCVTTLKLPEWNLPIVEGRHGLIEGHMYAYLARCLAQLDLFELTGDQRLLAPTRRALDYLRHQRALVISGTNSIAECWHSDQTGAGDLGETCATAYLIRLLSRLLQLEGDGWYGDWMERSIYNALFAAQSPDGRQLRYYVPLAGPRKYWDRDTYCCPGNYRRLIAELPEMIAYRQPGGVTLNLYTECEINTRLDDGTPLILRQHTDYPNSGQVRVEVRPARPARFMVRLRQPAWCAAFTIDSVTQTGHAHFRELTRAWRPGDQITIDMPMPWRLVHGFRQQAGKVAVMRGPQLFCLRPPTDLDPAALRLLPATLQSPAPNSAARPDGLGGRVRATAAGREVELSLTEFPDPEGQITYLGCGDSSLLTEDEILTNGGGECCCATKS